MKVVCVIPTYNEKENILSLIEKIHKLYPELYILVVDDNSPDGTGQIVEQLKNPKINILHREKKEGLGRAYLSGFTAALQDGADVLIQMDADHSHDPVFIKDMLDNIGQYDVIIGSRYLNGISIVNWPLSRLFLSYFGNIYARIMTGVKISDLTGGFKCIKRHVLENLDFSKIKTTGYGYQVEMNCAFVKKGFKVKEVPIIFYERTIGKSNMSKKIIIEAMMKVPFFRWKKY